MAKRDTDLGVQFGMERDPAYDAVKAKQEGSAKAKGVLRGAGYARGGGVSPVKAVHKHEGHMHKGEKKTAFKHGGHVEGKKTAARADKFARGGSKPRGHHTRVNINVGAGEAEKQNAMKTGMALGAKMAAAKMGGAPRPVAGAPMQARPPMPAPAPGGAPPRMQKNGGRTYAAGGKVGPVRVAGTTHLKGGAGGAKGRLSKIASYGTKPKK